MKKLLQIKQKNVDPENKLTDLTKKVEQVSEKGYDILLGRVYFTDDDGFHNFLVFDAILSSLTLDSNEKVANWISTGILSEKIKPFDTKLEPTMSNLANGRVILISSDSVLVQKDSSSLYINFTLNLYIVYELNNRHVILAIILN